MSLWDKTKHVMSKIALGDAANFEVDEKAKSELEERGKKNQSAQDEFVGWLYKANRIGASNKLSVKEKRKLLGKHLDTLSEEAYQLYFDKIMEIVQKAKDKCSPFKNTEEQVNNICSWLPRMNDNRELLTLFIQERRKKYGLKV